MSETRLVTREELVKLVNAELGVPLKLSRLEKMAHQGVGPRVAARFGRRVLYDPNEALSWAATLVEKADDTEAA
jgi:hypothetical protein